MEVSVCRLAHSRHFMQLVEQLVCVELVRQERQSLVAERLPGNTIQSSCHHTEPENKQVIWEERVAIPHGRECTRPMLTTDESNHSAVGTLHPHRITTYRIRYTALTDFPSQKRKFAPSLTGDINPQMKIAYNSAYVQIGIHTLNYCNYFCRIDWSNLVYGHFGP